MTGSSDATVCANRDTHKHKANDNTTATKHNQA